jgi:hypothetical protein
VSIYTKPLSKITTADLQELVTDNAVENVRLEYKSAVPSKDETLKKLSSFANTFGGFLLIGAKADSKDGRIHDLPGVSPGNGYKQKVVQWCFDGASPPLLVEVSDPIPTPAAKGQVCYVIFVAESDVAPHFLNGRRGVWVRTDEFSSRFEAQLADENELKHLLDRRRIVRERRLRLVERARKRFNTHINKKHTDASGQKTKVSPLLEFSVIPRFPSRQLCEQAVLEGYVKNHMNWRQQIFPDFTRRPILWQHESAIVLDAAAGRTSILEVDVWGSLYYGVELETGYPGDREGIHPYELVGYILLFIRHAGRIFQAMGYSGTLLIDVSLDSILGVPWMNPSYGGGVLAGPNSELDDEIALSLATTGDALIQQPDGIALDIVRRVFFSVNWPGLVATPQSAEMLIRKAYDFNSWPMPTDLKT